MDCNTCIDLGLLKVFPLYCVLLVGIRIRCNDVASRSQNWWVVRIAHKAARVSACLVKIHEACIEGISFVYVSPAFQRIDQLFSSS